MHTTKSYKSVKDRYDRKIGRKYLHAFLRRGNKNSKQLHEKVSNLINDQGDAK